MTRYLLDVNVLIALLDPLHVHNAQANEWFNAVGAEAWATCPLTENAILRILGSPRYPNYPGSANLVLDLLRELCALPGHEFWPDSISLRTPALLNSGLVLESAHITDIYLLALAAAHGGLLATYDAHLFTAMVRNGASSLHLLKP